jgi:putative transposase
MPQSFSNILVHIVFSTKHRVPCLKDGLRQRLHAYMANTVRNLENCEAYRVNGVEDHVHLAVRLSRTVTIADLLQHVKANSSRWLKEQDEALEKFAWQKGYASLSAYYGGLDKLLAYIDRQEEHHRTVTFQEEYIQLLKEHGIPYDERYMWD